MTQNFTILTIVPPIAILLCAFITKRIMLSLTIGILIASLIAKNFAILAALDLAYNAVLTNLEFNNFFSSQNFWQTWSLFICIFLLVLGVIVALLQHSGGAYAYATFIKRYIKSKRSAETSSLILSTCLLIDDYFNSLTVGSIMHPLTDAYKVPRVKLALLVHSLSSPLVILCPFSSWVAAIIGYLRDNGIATIATSTTFVLANPLVVYSHIIPFVLYSLILIASIWYITQTRISFGSMRRYELIAEQTGNLFGGTEPPKYLANGVAMPQKLGATLADFFTPIFMIISCIILSLLYSGKWQYLGGGNNLTQALQQASAASGLFIGGNIALILCISFLMIRRRITIAELPMIFKEGINLMLPAVTTLILAWSFGYILRTELHTGEYLAKILISNVDIHFLPSLLFVTATVIAFTIGTAWGTAAMLFPIAIPMVPFMLGFTQIPTLDEVPMLIPVLGAILSGCIAGNHISPLADTSIMSASSTKTPIMDHIHTQIPYAMPVMIATTVSFYLVAKLLCYGVWFAWIITLPFGIILAIIIMHGLHLLDNMRGIKLDSKDARPTVTI